MFVILTPVLWRIDEESPYKSLRNNRKTEIFQQFVPHWFHGALLLYPARYKTFDGVMRGSSTFLKTAVLFCGIGIWRLFVYKITKYIYQSINSSNRISVINQIILFTVLKNTTYTGIWWYSFSNHAANKEIHLLKRRC